MSISAEEKVCYLREAAIVLAKEGFQLDEVHTDRLCIHNLPPCCLRISDSDIFVN